ncbi:MAG TPA: VOC family protein [Streptosporangiaceae bacterium]|nr:VOC family protein [Streptosporangiaceae bacterium]
MELAQARLLADDVERLAAFYAALLGSAVALNEYYVEVPAGAVSVGLSKRRFAERDEHKVARGCRPARQAAFMLDFLASDADAEYARIAALGVDWLMPPTTQPWGNRSMIFEDPAGNLVNVFSRPEIFGHHVCKA